MSEVERLEAAVIRLCDMLQHAFVGVNGNSPEWIRWGDQLEKIKVELTKGRHDPYR